jgi:hypothetical protein
MLLFLTMMVILGEIHVFFNSAEKAYLKKMRISTA